MESLPSPEIKNSPKKIGFGDVVAREEEEYDLKKRSHYRVTRHYVVNQVQDSKNGVAHVGAALIVKNDDGVVFLRGGGTLNTGEIEATDEPAWSLEQIVQGYVNDAHTKWDPNRLREIMEPESLKEPLEYEG